jgi:flavin-dependent dehydrogenase
LSDDLIGVALLWSEPTEVPASEGRLRAWLERFTGLSERFANAEVHGRGLGLGPMAVQARRAAGPGFCVVGDALCFFDGIIGEGLTCAFAQAIVVGEQLNGLLHSPSPRRDQALDQALRATFAGKRSLARAALRLHSAPGWRRRVIGALAAQPAALDYLLACASGQARPSRLPLALFKALPYLLRGTGRASASPG